MPYLQGFLLYLLSVMKAKKETNIEANTDEEILRMQLQEKDRILKEKDNEIFKLRAQLAYLIRQKFGRKSERYVDPDQLSLFEMQELLTKDQIETTAEEKPSPQVPKKKPKRKPITKDLPRKTEVIEPENLPQGAKKIGEEVTEKLEYTPGELWVRRIVRPKYIIASTQEIVIGELPSFVIEKGIAGASLIAYLMVSKLVDHQPFYRLVGILKRANVHLSEATINNWFAKAADLLDVLYLALKKQTLASEYIQADETTIKVLESNKPGSTHLGYFWAYYAPRVGALFFEYAPTRAAWVPNTVLENYQGALQTDGYVGYEKVNKQITRLACMAHARRYFEKAKDEDPDRANYILAQIQRLYAIERQTAELNNEQRYQIRQAQAVPILQQIKEWLEANRNKLLPKSNMGKAFVYTLNQWTRLCEYTQSGEYIIDNNPIENKIRPIALGRKNYLFAGNDKAAQRAAIIYSLMAACKINDINPQLWLEDVMRKLPEYKANKVEELLPANWKIHNLKGV